MNYKTMEEMSEYTLTYGAKNIRNKVVFALLVKNESSNHGYSVYIMDNIGSDRGLTVSELEKKFYENPENFNIPLSLLRLTKRKEEYDFMSYNNVRIFDDEAKMTLFEKKMLELLKESYNCCHTSRNETMLEPGNVDLTEDKKSQMMNYTYAKSENMPEIALSYGNHGFIWCDIWLSLLVKETDENGDLKYYVYYIKRPDCTELFDLSFLEDLYYLNPNEFNLSNMRFNLNRKEVTDEDFSYGSFRYISEESYMSDFEKAMFTFFKKAYEIKKQKGKLDLLKPGEIGITPECKMYLYLGKFDNASVKLITLKEYDRKRPVPTGLEREREVGQIRKMITTVEEDKVIEKKYNSNTNVYIELNSKYIQTKFYNFDYDISNISPEELMEMVVGILPRNQRIRIAKKYEGRLDYAISNPENPISEVNLYIPGTSYNQNHQKLTRELFKNRIICGGAYLHEKEGSNNFFISVMSTRFRKIKIHLGNMIL